MCEILEKAGIDGLCTQYYASGMVGYRDDTRKYCLASLFVITFKRLHSSPLCPCSFHPMVWHSVSQYRAFLHPMHLCCAMCAAYLVHVQHPLCVRGGGCCSALHPRKAPSKMMVVFGFVICTLVIEVQSENACFPMLVTEGGILTVTRELHPSKACIPMLVTQGGMVTLANEVHL